MTTITKEEVQEILNKYPHLFEERGTINPEGLVSGVSSAANPHNGEIIDFEEFKNRLKRENDATFNEQSVGEIPSEDDKRVLFYYLQQQHGVKPTFAPLSEFIKANNLSKSKPAKSVTGKVKKVGKKGGSHKKTHRRKSKRRRNKTSCLY